MPVLDCLGASQCLIALSIDIRALFLGLIHFSVILLWNPKIEFQTADQRKDVLDSLHQDSWKVSTMEIGIASQLQQGPRDLLP